MYHSHCCHGAPTPTLQTPRRVRLILLLSSSFSEAALFIPSPPEYSLVSQSKGGLSVRGRVPEAQSSSGGLQFLGSNRGPLRTPQAVEHSKSVSFSILALSDRLKRSPAHQQVSRRWSGTSISTFAVATFD